MDVDPVDGGPKVHAATMFVNKEEEARQAIEMLRGDDVSARVAAAHRLDVVAAALGEERTREVSVNKTSERLCGSQTCGGADRRLCFVFRNSFLS